MFAVDNWDNQWKDLIVAKTMQGVDSSWRNLEVAAVSWFLVIWHGGKCASPPTLTLQYSSGFMPGVLLMLMSLSNVRLLGKGYPLGHVSLKT